jgi:hypothetical protein
VKSWKACVIGLVTRLREDGARVSVPHGEYEITEAPDGTYKLSSPQLTFYLTIVELSTYTNDRKLKVDDGFP